MSKFYEREVITELMNAVPFEQVLTHYGFPLQGTRKNRGSDCPKCGKDSGHFKINTFKNLSNCFVCGYSGNTIQFVQTVENIGFIAAVEKLAAIGGFSLPSPGTSKGKRSLSVSDKIMFHAAQFYKTFETTYPEERGIKKELIESYEIGFAPGGTVLKDYLLDKGYTEEQLIESGVIVRRNGKLMDFFYNCVIFPIVQNGIVVDLYGRHIGKGKSKHIYLKGDFIIYNIDSINNEKPVVYVESIINALSIISLGYKNVIAVGGASKFTRKHVQILRSKGVKSMINAFDTGDTSGAGQEGAIASGNIVEQEGLNHRVMELPQDVDVNDLILLNNGPNEFAMRLLKSCSTLEFELKYKLSKMPVQWIESYIKERKTI